MSKPKIIKSSPEGTPAEDILYVLEYPEVSRIKVRKIDLIKEIEQIDKELVLKQVRREEINELLKEIDKI